jgi:predicted DCC family thiol-disulfide oxidoreductase YuxK
VDVTRHLIVWDGACGFCRRAVAWAIAHDTRGTFEAIPYQEVPSPPMTPALREACRGAVHVHTTDGRWLKGGQACLFVLERIGWPRLAGVASLPPFIWAVEAGYALVAQNRPLYSRLFPNRREARSDLGH